MGGMGGEGVFPKWGRDPERTGRGRAETTLKGTELRKDRPVTGGTQKVGSQSGIPKERGPKKREPKERETKSRIPKRGTPK